MLELFELMPPEGQRALVWTLLLIGLYIGTLSLSLIKILKG